VSERLRLEAELRRRETLSAMGSLVAGVAHEVRTPLFSLSATLDALEAGAGTPAQRQELEALLRSQLRRLSNLMQDLLDYGRPHALSLAPARLADAVAGAARSCASLAENAGVAVQVDASRDLPPVEADAVRMEQVFQNLLANALQHSRRGSTVRVAVREAPGGQVCTVTDEGPGLRPGDVEKVFEPFFSRRKGGTGLGLAIAQRFVEAHRGSLTAANPPAGGAQFTVFLPGGPAGRGGGFG
jgi:signal transduction histidine kinase